VVGAMLRDSGFQPPSPPSGLAIIPLLLAPIVIAMLVRLIGSGLRRLRR
jgi:hypothetical protein